MATNISTKTEKGLTEKQNIWFNKRITRLETIKDKIKSLDEEKKKLEAEIEEKSKLILPENEKSFETDTFKVTFSPTLSYKIESSTMELIKNNEGLESPFFKISADMDVVRKSGKYNEFVECKEGKMKVLVKRI